MGRRLGAMAMQALALILLGLAACASAQYSSCPEPYGLQLYPHEQYCGKRVYDDTPISSPGCLYQFGIYPVGEGCQTTFFKCAAGVAYETPCYKGLAYNPEIHVCDYPDSVPYCEKQSEGVVGFKCPQAHELPPNAVARRFLPFPRFPMPGDESAYIVCVADNL